MLHDMLMVSSLLYENDQKLNNSLQQQSQKKSISFFQIFLLFQAMKLVLKKDSWSIKQIPFEQEIDQLILDIETKLCISLPDDPGFVFLLSNNDNKFLYIGVADNETSIEKCAQELCANDPIVTKPLTTIWQKWVKSKTFYHQSKDHLAI